MVSRRIMVLSRIIRRRMLDRMRVLLRVLALTAVLGMDVLGMAVEVAPELAWDMVGSGMFGPKPMCMA
jgi:hypothetical protein